MTLRKLFILALCFAVPIIVMAQGRTVIGYCHVAKSGFLFRVGFNPAFNFGGEHAISRAYGSDTFHKFSLGAYLGFGWAF